MSEVKTDVAVEEEKKQPLCIKVPQEEKLAFPTVAYSTYITSDSFCKTANSLFGSVFADFEGFGMWLEFRQLANGNQVPVLTMRAFFNQIGGEKTSDKFYAFECDATNKNKSEGLSRIFRVERIAQEGNKFHLTDEAKELLDPFVIREARLFNHKNEVNWDARGLITCNVSQREFGAATTTYSVVNYLDPIKILREMYGANFDKVGYQIIPMPMINNNQMNQFGIQKSSNEGPFNLYINQIDVANADDAALAMGVYVPMGPRFMHVNDQK